ncbi:MAG: efflux RND transporter periplasmic adaptor subunit [Opitutales bacterium]
MPTKIHVTGPIVLLCLLLAGCGVQGDEKSGGASGAGGPPQAVPVGYLELQPTPLSRTDRLPGRVVSYQVAEIRPQVSGIIQERLFDEGTFVEEGQQLYQIDPALYEAELALARANRQDAEARLANARRQAERAERLLADEAISQQQYDDARFAREQAVAVASRAEAEVQLAEINLAYTEVRSPLSGFIGPSGVTKGALVTARQAMPLATVRQLDPVYVDITQAVSETRALRQRLMAAREDGAETPFEVRLYLESGGEAYPLKGRLDATDPAVDPRTGAIRLRTVFPNPDNSLLPGMFVEAAIDGANGDAAILVPQKSVRIGPSGDKQVWVVGPDNQARRQTIRTDGTYDNNWIVREDLQAGDRVIVEGTMGLREGAPVAPEKIRAASADTGEG